MYVSLIPSLDIMEQKSGAKSADSLVAPHSEKKKQNKFILKYSVCFSNIKYQSLVLFK